MAYIPGYKYDVFISYPRESNRADPQGTQWVREFHRCLETAINQRIPSNEHPAIYFDDHDFEGGQHSDSLIDAARNSALFLAIVSPPYVAPGKFTLRELRAFCDAHQNRSQVIVSVYFLPIDDALRPPELENPRRIEFYLTNESNVPVPLTSRGDEYISKVHTVAHHIKNRLDELRRGSSSSTVTEPIGPLTGKTVLLSKVMDDLVDTRDEVRVHLERLGAAVLPEGEFPPWGPDFVREFKAQLPRADLFVQLLSKVRSDKRDDETLSCAQFQHRTALEVGKDIMQWRDPSDISKVQHYDKALLEGAAAMGLEQFKNAVRKKLEQQPSPAPVPIERGVDPFIYITAADEDLSRAFELKEIADTLGAAKIMEDEDKLKDFRKQVADAEAVVFLYGDAPRKFVDDWLATYLKWRTKQVKKSPQMEVVYYAPPPKSGSTQKLRTGWKGLREYGSQDTFSAEDIYKIFAELRRGSAR